MQDNSWEGTKSLTASKITSLQQALRDRMGVGQRPYMQQPVPKADEAEYEQFLKETGKGE